jgi:hypothetical protein
MHKGQGSTYPPNSLVHAVVTFNLDGVLQQYVKRKASPEIQWAAESYKQWIILRREGGIEKVQTPEALSAKNTARIAIFCTPVQR